MRTNSLPVVVRVLTVSGLLPLFGLGQAIVLRQGDTEMGGVTFPVSETDEARGVPDSDVARERKVLHIQRRLLQKKRDVIEARVLALPEIAEALAAAREAAIAYYAALAENQAYRALREEKERLIRERRELWAAAEGTEKAKRLAKQKALPAQIDAVSKKIGTFPDTLPIFRNLKQRKAQAVSAFLEAYHTELGAYPEWEALGQQLDELDAWSRDLNEQQQTQSR